MKTMTVFEARNHFSRIARARRGKPIAIEALRGQVQQRRGDRTGPSSRRRRAK